MKVISKNRRSTLNTKKLSTTVYLFVAPRVAPFLASIIALGIGAAQMPVQAATAFQSTSEPGDYIVKFEPSKMATYRINLRGALPANSKVEDLNFDGWARVQLPKSQLRSFGGINALSKINGVEYIQPNYKIKLLDQPGVSEIRAQLASLGIKKSQNLTDDCSITGVCNFKNNSVPTQDNPEIPAAPTPTAGDDPLFNNQWGMLDIGVSQAWNKSRGTKNIIVAVIDTGVDYQHEDLVENLWRNPGESGTDSEGRNQATNGIDDDGNGYIDDVIGWDFASNDNKPYDLAVEPIKLIFEGGNPGHGTHCAGNVAARGLNGKGVSGVAPNVSIMALRFLTEKGEGTTAGAIQAIAYAIRNGAVVTSNSWGSEGEDGGEANDNKALRDVIQAAQDHGVLFVAAAGNGHSGVGYDNDSDPKPGYPASYNHDVIISVAALDANNALGSFSNWGKTSVDIGAPGVKVYSTTVGSKYSDTVLDMYGFKVTWDGTSMATPHVAGALALYLSKNPGATWQQAKAALIQSATPIPSLTGKSVSGGKLNLLSFL